MTQPDRHITSSSAKVGGTCPACGLAIGKFNRIHKYTVVGKTGSTAAGNGPGVWVCTFCHDRRKLEQQRDAIAEIDLWECAACLKMSNPVIMIDDRVLCSDCYGSFSAESGRLV